MTEGKLKFICKYFPGMYCMDGDIAGATTILEHMKQVKIFTLYERTSILLSSVSDPD
jgi:hypothetical protein